MSPVVPLPGRIFVMPFPVVDGNLHFRWVAVVQIIGTAIVLIAVVILWIIDVRVMHKAIVVAWYIGTSPSGPISLGLLRICHGNHPRQNSGGKRGGDYFLSEHPENLHDPMRIEYRPSMLRHPTKPRSLIFVGNDTIDT